MAKADLMSVRVLPGRVLTHDGERLEAGEVLDLTAAQAKGLLAAGHVERVAIEADDNEGDDDTDAEDPTKDPAK